MAVLALVPVNTAPPVITGTPTVASTLTCQSGTWTGSPTFTFDYVWSADSAPIAGATSASYVVQPTYQGDTLTCTLTATNAGPRSPRLRPCSCRRVADECIQPSITGTVAVGSTVTCDPGSWTGAPSYNFAWQDNGAPIAAATAPTYAVPLTYEGTKLTCVVTASNIVGAVSAASAATAVPLVAPTNTTPPSITGTLAVGAALVCTSGVWTGGPTYKYAWDRNGSAISGAVTAAYTVQAADEGDALTCVVTASNAAGATSAVSTGDVVPLLDAVGTKVPTITGTPKVGAVLTCASGSWTGSPVYSYSWSRDGASISGATSSSYTVQVADATNKLTCTVTATNVVGLRPSRRALPSAFRSAPPTNTASLSISGTLKVGLGPDLRGRDLDRKANVQIRLEARRNHRRCCDQLDLYHADTGRERDVDVHGDRDATLQGRHQRRVHPRMCRRFDLPRRAADAQRHSKDWRVAELQERHVERDARLRLPMESQRGGRSAERPRPPTRSSLRTPGSTST